MPANTRAHYRGNYPRQAAHVRAAAYLNADTRCTKCGLTLAEGIARYGRQRARWDAGHLNDAEVNGVLVPQHATCNRSDGATKGNMRRGSGYTWP
jgi:hypothetical protein